MSFLKDLCAVALLSLAVASVQAKPGILDAKPGFMEPPALDPAFLPVDQAFEIQPLKVTKDGGLRVGWRIAPGYFLYRPKARIQVLAPEGLKLEDALLPPGTIHEDELFGRVEIYQAPLLQVLLPVKGGGRLPPKLSLKVSYQGCAEAGLCYPPQDRVLDWSARRP